MNQNGNPVKPTDTLLPRKAGSKIRIFFRKISRRGLISQQLGLVGALILLMIALTILSPFFATISNMQNVFRQISMTAIIGFCMTLLMIGGGVDLSVGSVMALASATTVQLIIKFHWPSWTALIVGLIAASAVGYINGLLITKLKLSALMVTIAMLTLIRGVAYVVTSYIAVIHSDPLLKWLGISFIGPIPVPVFIAVILFIVTYFIQNRTVIGRYLYAIGGNEEAARLSGLKVDRIRIIFYVATAFSAGLAGLILSGRLTSAQPLAGQGMEFDAITAVVIGGTSLSGGRGNVFGTIIGALLVGVIANGMILLGMPYYAQFIVKGAIILLALWMDEQFRRRFYKIGIS